MRGVQITNGVRVPYAKADDFVLNTEFLGGMKVGEKRFFNPFTEFTLDPMGFRRLVYPHRLDYVPAVIAFQNGQQSLGWQNEALMFNMSANADGTNVYMMTDEFIPANTTICLVIFQEKVADS